MQPYNPDPNQRPHSGPPYSGAPYGAPYGAAYGPPQRIVPTSGAAVASLVLGLLGLTGVCCWPLVVLSFIGVICGHLALGETRSGTKAGNGLAVSGLIVSYLSVVPTAVVLIMAVMGAGLSAFGIDAGSTP
jgi:hypothetical protein